MMRNAVAAALLLASTALAQQVTTQPPKPTLRELTIENIFDPKQRVAFSGAQQSGFVWLVRNSNLYVVDVASQRERQLTTDGNDDLLNGMLDWVYQEEIFGRGNFHAYWWSPDSSRIAYLQLDERPVKRFTVVDHIPLMQNVEITPYPKA